MATALRRRARRRGPFAGGQRHGDGAGGRPAGSRRELEGAGVSEWTDTPLDFRRDRWGRAIIQGKPYGRPSRPAKVIEDQYGLELWARRNVAYGLAHDPSLVARVLALPSKYDEWSKDDKAAANKIVTDAQAVAKAHKAADIGTALHRITERIDAGETVDAGIYQADIDAYRQAMAPLAISHVECRMVCHELELAGTADRLVHHDGHHYIADVKTGADLSYAGLGYATQLAVYAHSVLWDLESDQAMETPPINTDRALIIHLPAGQGRCELQWVDIAQGWEIAHLATPATFTTPPPDIDAGPTADDVKARLASLPDDLAAKVRADLKAKGVTTRSPARAMELLEEIVAFETVTATQVTKVSSRARKAKNKPPIAEGADVASADLEGINVALTFLPADGRAWVDALTAQAYTAKVPISLTQRASQRRWNIARGLLALAQAEADDELLRAILRHTTGTDAVLFASVEPGAALGSLTLAESERLVVTCEAFVAGDLLLGVDDESGALEVVG